jgi:hypothetical protein
MDGEASRAVEFGSVSCPYCGGRVERARHADKRQAVREYVLSGGPGHVVEAWACRRCPRVLIEVCPDASCSTHGY